VTAFYNTLPALRWLVIPGTWSKLHRVTGGRTDEEHIAVNYATTACGLAPRRMVMPGVISRLGLPRCAHCCKKLGVSRGDGAPFNHGMPDK
jgi:hypothetical protein